MQELVTSENAQDNTLSKSRPSHLLEGTRWSKATDGMNSPILLQILTQINFQDTQ